MSKKPKKFRVEMRNGAMFVLTRPTSGAPMRLVISSPDVEITLDMTENTGNGLAESLLAFLPTPEAGK